jgi:Pretoxin HINT domain
VGRFISVDPAGFGAGDTNLYRYVGNSSTMATDPTGMWSLQEAWNSGVNSVQQGWNNLTHGAQQTAQNIGQGAVESLQVAADYWGGVGKNLYNGFTDNGFTQAAQRNTEYFANIADRGEREGDWGDISLGWGLGLINSAFTKHNIVKTTAVLATPLVLPAAAEWAASTAVGRILLAIPGVVPVVRIGLAGMGLHQGGQDVSQAWIGVGENGRRLSTVERWVTGFNGVAAIGTSLLGLNFSNCFIAGTEIQTIDGTKNIEDIHVGDWVLSDDPTTVGDIEYKQVLQTFAHDATKFVDVYIGGEKITTTEEHPFWVPDLGWVMAKDLHAGSHLQTKYESWLDVDKVELHGGLATVYNFEVQGFHTYFVSDLGLLVHNTCKLEPRSNAVGEHTVFKRDNETGKIRGYEEFVPNTSEYPKYHNPQFPKSWKSVKRVDLEGAEHYNKITKEYVPTPHVQANDIPGGVRRAEPWEIPKS